MSTIAALTFSGSSREVGRQHAEHAAPFFKEELATSLPLWQAADTTLRYQAMVHYLSCEFPDLYDEGMGFAEVLGIPVGQALWATLAPAYAPELELVQNSTVIWRHRREGPVLFRTENGLPLDKEVDAGEAMAQRVRLLAVVDHDSVGCNRSTGLWRLGKIGLQAGINASGLLISYTVGRPCLSTIENGLASSLLATVLLRTCETVEDVYEMARKIPLVGNGANLIAADATGLLASIEKAGDYVNIRTGGDYQVGVNHLHDESMREMIRRADADWLESEEYASSRARAQFVENRMLYIGARYRLSAHEQLSKLLEHRSGAVCQHGDAEAYQTDYAVLITAGTGMLELFVGPPCLGDSHQFPVVERLATA